MPGQKDDRIRKGKLFDEQRKKEEEDGGVDFEAIFARIAKTWFWHSFSSCRISPPSPSTWA